MTKKQGQGGLQRAADIIRSRKAFAKQISGPSAIDKRIVDTAIWQLENPSDPRTLLYQHSVLCQTYLPYRNPGDDLREWERRNGDVHLLVKAGEAMHPEKRQLVKFGLPFGPKCRLVLMYINQRAIVSQSPQLHDIQDSLTAFVRRVLKLDPKGRNIEDVKTQLQRLSTAAITLGYVGDFSEGTEAGTDFIRVVRHFSLWLPKDERQRVLWPSYIDLSHDYFETLLAHAVPLDEAHIAALSHSGMALDIYAWLAQRLHRIPANRPAFVPWIALHAQFGQGYTGPNALRSFRADFRTALRQVIALYKAARIEDDKAKQPRRYLHAGKTLWREPIAKGLTLYNSPPPVKKLIV